MIQLFGIGIIAYLLFLAQQKIYSRMWNRHLKASLAFSSPAIFEGDRGELKEIVENRKRLPLSMLKVKFQTSRYLVFEDALGSRTTDQYYRNDVFQIGGGEKITRTLSFTGGKRGYYQINGIDLVSTDLFMTGEYMDTVPQKLSVYVYPKPYDSREFRMSLQQLNGEALSKRHLLEDPFEYRGIREYQPFDDMRSINWKATAKTDEWKVNQKNYTALKSVRIFLNVEDTGILKKTECVEASIRIATALSEFFLRQGMQVSFYCNSIDILDRRPVCIEASAGQGQMGHIYRALARLDTESPVTDFREQFGRRVLTEAAGTLTCVVAPNFYDNFVPLMEEYKNTGRDLAWYCPVWESTDPVLPEALADNIRLIHVRNGKA